MRIFPNRNPTIASWQSERRADEKPVLAFDVIGVGWDVMAELRCAYSALRG